MIRVGQGFDVHRLVVGRPLIIGGVTINHSHGLLGHSDADVLLHALSDAILGALALGDIGQLYPDTAEETEDMDSRVILREVWELAKMNGFTLGNADLTVMAERPKLAPYNRQIRESIAEIFDVDIEQISLKATTMEQLGFVGREEGIAALAIVLLNKENE
jgi:2-C-methyl-D-erythritol 2,4-cyclodiphosphate synthase